MQVWARITPKIIRQFDRVAKRNGATRAAMIARLIEQAIKDDHAAQTRIFSTEPVALGGVQR